MPSKGLHRLAGDLSEALSGDQRAALVFRSDPRGDLHHKAAHDEGKIILRTVQADLLLNLGKTDHCKLNPAGIGGHPAAKLLDLEQRPFAGIGWTGKMNRHDLHPALGHHIACDRGINAAGKQKGGASAGADRNPPAPGCCPA